MRIALVQSSDLENGKITRDEVRALIERESKPGDFWILPEVFDTGWNVSKSTDFYGKRNIEFFRNISQTFGISICGSFYEKIYDKYLNRFCAISRDGSQYLGGKRHLFGNFEKGSVMPVESILNFQIDGIVFRAVVCYDLRFPVWCRNSKPSYDALICVSQWPLQRQADRHLLMAARAVENVAYSINCNGLGTSVVYDPHGQKTLMMDTATQVAFFDLDPESVPEIRQHKKYLSDADEFSIRY